MTKAAEKKTDNPPAIRADQSSFILRLERVLQEEGNEDAYEFFSNLLVEQKEDIVFKVYREGYSKDVFSFEEWIKRGQVSIEAAKSAVVSTHRFIERFQGFKEDTLKLLAIAILELDVDFSIEGLDITSLLEYESSKYMTFHLICDILERDIFNKAGRPTASQILNDEKFRAAAEAKAVGAMFASARGDTSQRATAKASGIDPKNLRQIESGDTDPSLKTMRKIADSIGYDVEITLTPKGNS